MSIFNEFGVEYLVVGGHAVMQYTEPRFTKDLDLWVAATPDNALRVYEALTRFGAPLQGLSANDFAAADGFYQLGRPPLRVDILLSLDGLTFGEAWPNRMAGKLYGVGVHFIGKQDLIRNKLATGRHIDLHDAENLGREIR